MSRRSFPGRALFGAVALLLALVGCAKPAPSPEPTPPPAPSLQPYADAARGFSFQHPNDWPVTSSPAQEGPIALLTSPDGAILIQIIRDFPPPVVDLPGYGKAMTHALQRSMPDLEVQEEGTTSRGDGTPTYHARFIIGGQTPQSGEILILYRGSEAFMVQAAGPQGPYLAWTPGIRTVLDSFQLTPVAKPTPAS